MDRKIVEAIQTRHLLTFIFDGKWRTVEPHTYGADAKQVDKLSAWQLTGQPGDQPDWRMYTCDEISSLQTVPQTFANARDEYKRNDKRMRTIYAQL